ncbi:hypothetical protein AZH53_00820 [Methanomicrobiaceae archaeon CYW5]|nr:hypothetical protein [Methanovulcanius yangii]
MISLSSNDNKAAPGEKGTDSFPIEKESGDIGWDMVQRDVLVSYMECIAAYVQRKRREKGSVSAFLYAHP